MQHRTLIIFLNSILFTVVFNSILLSHRYLEYQLISEYIAYSIALEAVLSVFLVFPLLYICSISSVLTVIIYVISGVAAYFSYQFNIKINSEMIAVFFEADTAEIKNFININLILVMIFSGLLGMLCSFTAKRSKVNKSEHRKISVVCLVFALGSIIGDGEVIANAFPFNIIKESGIYWLEKTSLVDKRTDISKIYEYKQDDKYNDLNVVLIIGESLRADHFGLNGYKRDTTPYLSQEKNIINYEKVTACFPLTRIAVPCMLTRGTRADKSLSKTETSFISVFRKLGIYTAWIGIQGLPTAIDAPYLELAKEANKVLLPSTEISVDLNDSKLLPLVNQFYQENNKQSNLLVLHTYGSHFPYEERYIDEFRKYKPVCNSEFWHGMKSCDDNQVINSYDNSILFTDYFIKQVIDQLRDKNALVIYTSDHGESLGENGRYYHGTYDKNEQIAVPMIFWASDKYIKNYPKKFDRLRESKDKAILHDNIFHTILGCSGIKSSIIDNKLNLCAE